MSKSGELRESLVRRMLNGEGVSQLSAETGLGLSTLYRWRVEAQRGDAGVSKGKKDRLSGAQKLAVLAETAGLNEAELGEYCRRKGLYAEQVKGWREQAEQAVGGATVSAKVHREALEAEKQRTGAEKKRTAALERELRRKEQALAETAALLVLRKKAQAIWGKEEDE
jgi:transposase-like protein